MSHRAGLYGLEAKIFASTRIQNVDCPTHNLITIPAELSQLSPV